MTLLERLKKAYEYCDTMSKIYDRQDLSMIWTGQGYKSQSQLAMKFWEQAKYKIGFEIFKRSLDIESFKTGVR